MANNLPPAWKEEALLLFGVAAGAGMLSLAGGGVWPWLIALAGYTGWHLYQLSRFPGRLERMRRNRRPPPSVPGLWKSAYHRLEQFQNACSERERVLSRTIDLFREAVSARPDAVVIVDHEQHIVWANPAAAALLGVDMTVAAGKPLTEVATDPLLEDYLARGDFTRPQIITSPADRSRILSIQATVSGTPPGHLLVVASDISHQYHLDATKRDLVANVSHELRTPLTVISGLLEQISTGDCDPALTQHAHRRMQQQVERMRDLVSDLLTLSRLELASRPLEDETVAVPELLATIADEARTLSAGTRHEIQLQLDSDACLLGNFADLHKAFSNLVINAVKHTPNRSQVNIRWFTDQDKACLSVTDTGEGIAARHLARLTERFYRVDTSRSRETGGTGLGLAIVKHALDRHDARLTISSTEGRGSSFTCHFPAERVRVITCTAEDSGDTTGNNT